MPVPSQEQGCDPLLPPPSPMGTLTESFFSEILRTSERERAELVPLLVHFYQKHTKKKPAFGCTCKYFTGKWPREGFSLLLEPDSFRNSAFSKNCSGIPSTCPTFHLCSNVRLFLRAFFGDIYGNAETSRPVAHFSIIKISLKKDD